MEQINEFQGEFRWLSNFWPAPVSFEGHIYPSVENAYQAAKFHQEHRAPFSTCSPGAAKRLARTMPVRSDWESVKVVVMRSLIDQKFTADNALGAKLVATKTAYICEGNTWGDTFWGVCRCKGENILGKLLMRRRSELQASLE